MVDTPNPESGENGKPPKGNWEAKPDSQPHWVEVGTLIVLVIVGIFQICIYFKQANIMQTQADIALKQNEITVQSSRAIVFAKDVRVEKKDGPIPGQPGQFEAYWWFSAVVENGGNTSTKNLRISPQVAFDPSRPEIAVKLPLGMAFGPKQHMTISHLPEAGPVDPEERLIEAEELERQNKPSFITRTILGPHTPQAFAGFGIPIEEAKRRLQEGARWYLVGAIHYNDRFSNSSRLSKYCFAIGFEITATGELDPTTSPCPHWNCADEECEDDKAAYSTETADWRGTALLSLPASQPPFPPIPTPQAPVTK